VLQYKKVIILECCSSKQKQKNKKTKEKKRKRKRKNKTKERISVKKVQVWLYPLTQLVKI